MRKLLILATSLTLLALPAAAIAATPTPRHERQYQRAYHQVAQKLGRRAPGRNIVRDGTPTGPATDALVVKSTAVLRAMLIPPAVTPTIVGTKSGTKAVPSGTVSYTSVRHSYTSVPTRSGTNTTRSGGYAIPSGIVSCESGGNYSAVNPSSGAGGAYQILPSTWHAYGGQGLPQDASPAEQGRIAGEIWARQGRSAWSC